LEVRFGLGTCPELRKALYRRLERLVAEREGEAYYIISCVAAEANGKKDPGRYFAFSVTRRLREHALLPQIEL
jgi:sirohydrochlorin ferrochelatase